MFLAGLQAEIEDQFAPALANGDLIVMEEPGDSPASALAAWEARFWQAVTRDAPAIHALDFGTLLNNLGPAENGLAFEHSLSALVKRFPAVVLCAYNARHLDVPALLRAIKAHPDVFDYGLEHFRPEPWLRRPPRRDRRGHRSTSPSIAG